MIWSAPQEVGLDAQRVLHGIDSQVFLISSESVPLEKWAKLMSEKVDDLYDPVTYSPPPAAWGSPMYTARSLWYYRSTLLTTP